MSREDLVHPPKQKDKQWNEENCREVINRYRQEIELAEDENMSTLLEEIEEEIETEHGQSEIKSKWFLDTLITRLCEASACNELFALNSIMLELREEQRNYI